jgi:acetylornithine deacetylase/succinyl-diaminopimelate desuccinylase-like protein
MDERAAKAIRAFLVARRAEQFRFLRDLVRARSDNPPGDLAAHAGMLAERLTGLGLAAEVHAPPAELVRERGMASAANVVVRRGFGDGPAIALQAHADVPPPGDGWTVDPYGADIRDGVLFGRGVVMAKADVAAYTFALLALAASEAPLAGSVELHVTYDEEAGGQLGPKWLLDSGVARPDMAVCSGCSYAVVTYQQGCLHLQVDVLADPPAAGQPPADPLRAAARVLEAVERERTSLGAVRPRAPGIGRPSLVVGRIEGGTRPHVPAERVSLQLGRRFLPAEDPAALRRRLAGTIGKAVMGEKGLRCVVRPLFEDPPLKPVAGTQKLIDAFARRAGRVIGEKVTTGAFPFMTAARHYAAAGIPTICYGVGPKSALADGGRGADERLALDDLRKATEVIALALADLLAPRPAG